MTVDVDPPTPTNPDPNIIEDGVDVLLELFDNYAIKSTFFVPAVVAEKFPAVMKKIIKQRHEIACHGLRHDKNEAISDLSKQFKIIRAATNIIQSVVGTRPVGYRAPLFRINENCWIALQKNGYVYDSSLLCSILSRVHRTLLPSKPFFLSVHKTKENGTLLEIPISTNLFLPLPLGGAYLRVLGSKWSNIGVKANFLLQNPVVFHIHPKDIDSRTRGRQWWAYRNTSKCIIELEEIIKYAKQNGAKFLKAVELANLEIRKKHS